MTGKAVKPHCDGWDNLWDGFFQWGVDGFAGADPTTFNTLNSLRQNDFTAITIQHFYVNSGSEKDKLTKSPAAETGF